ncbi:MAG: 3-dehydroquinate synthase [Clostridia bacterium]|nr:3-dehydroquinate synthase [Clostridia bacterium]
MITVDVKLNTPYRVLIGHEIFEDLGKSVKSVLRANKLLIVTDSNVAPLYLDRAQKKLLSVGFEVYNFVFEAGEKSKTPKTYLDIIDCLAKNGFKRTDAVVALGGGVVGDIAGFAAATYMRGIDVVQVPTTLLAMIDSSVGGKTGVDLAYGKNLLGAFHQPKLVIADPDLLDSMPHREWCNGIGEGIKYACLAGGEIFEMVNDGLNEAVLDEFVALCVKYKADIVAKDEKEGGLRKLLNLGHTVGHAVEKLSDFKIAHGVAVAQGIYVMANAAKKHGELSDSDYDSIIDMLEFYLPNEYKFDGDISSAVANDKKAEGKNSISFIAIEGIGKCSIRTADIEEFNSYIG